MGLSKLQVRQEFQSETLHTGNGVANQGTLADRDRFILASQLAVLRSCPMVMSRLLRKSGSVLVASKVLVISRLLHKALSQRPNPPPYVDSLKTQLATLRRKLLSNIDRRLKNESTSADGLLEAMGAFSLATSSSPADVLKHFFHVRLQAMSALLGAQESGHESAAKALRLFMRTLQDTRSIVPQKLADALAKLKSFPLFKSPELHDLIELNLRVHERWIGDEIRSFTPYLRHDDLRKAEAEKLLRQWAEDALSAFIKGLLDILGRIEIPKVVVNLRRHLLEMWCSDHRHIIGVDSSRVLNTLREAFHDRLVRIMENEIGVLGNVGSIIKSTLQHWQSGISDASPSLWDVSMTSMDTSHGGGAFKSALISRSQGRTSAIREVLQVYSTWLHGIEEYESLTKQLRDERWEDDGDDLDEDEDMLDNKSVLLSEEESLPDFVANISHSRSLQGELEIFVGQAYLQLQDSLRDSVTSIVSNSRGPQATFLLRIIREISNCFPLSYTSSTFFSNFGLGNFGLSFLPQLHDTLINTALQNPLTTYTVRFTKALKHRRVPSRALWAGEPELPVQPSPSIFKFLQDLVNAMANGGSDVWSPAAKGVLKSRVRAALASQLETSAVASEGASEVNGHVDEGMKEERGEGGEEEENRREDGDGDEDVTMSPPASHGEVEKPISPNPHNHDRTQDFEKQLLFDLLYILCATPPPPSAYPQPQTQSQTPAPDSSPEANPLPERVRELQHKTQTSEADIARLTKGAEEYWTRTSLLFALLL